MSLGDVKEMLTNSFHFHSIKKQSYSYIDRTVNELTAYCIQGVSWAKKNHYPAIEDYPMYAEVRRIGEKLHDNYGFQTMQDVVQMVRERIPLHDGGETALLEYGWSGIGEWNP